MTRLLLRRVAWAAALLLAAGEAVARDSRIAPPDSYRRQLGIRLHGAMSHLALVDARLALHDENREMQSAGWAGGIREGDVARGYGGGLEVSWGVLADVKVTAAFEGLGASADGEFEGNGPSTTAIDPVLGVVRQHATRLDRYSVLVQTIGATVLMRDFEWSRLGLGVRAGVAELSGAVQRGREAGPIRTAWWQRTLAGVAPVLWLGVEWEWLTPAAALKMPLSLHAGLGYRYANLRHIAGTRTDSSGARTTGDWINPDGTHRTLDLSGIEARLGLQLIFDLTPRDEPVRPGVE